MRIKDFSCRIAFIFAIVFGVALHSGFAEATNAFQGTPLANEELGQLRGGFMTPSGNFIYFGMEFMQARFIAHNDPGDLGASGTFINALHQQATITKEGMAMDLQIFQGGGTGGQAIAVPIAKSAVANTIMGNKGLLNTNITVGNYNTSAITNLINIQVGFFNIQNSGQVRSVLGRWLGY